jgi:hypothetical protein
MNNLNKAAIFVAAQMSFAMVLPLMAAAADSSNVAPSSSATTAPTQSASSPYDPSGPGPGGGVYDNSDRFRDAKGFPLPGYAPLFEPTD